MLEIHKIRSQTDEIVAGLNRKGIADADDIIQQILQLDQQRRSLLVEVESLKQAGNAAAKSIGRLMSEGKKEEAEAAKKTSSESKHRIKDLDEQVKQVEKDTEQLLISLPNTPHQDVPTGKTPEDNVEVAQNAVRVNFDFEPLPHWDLARKHDLIDWELGVKVTGAGFPVFKGKGAQLLRGLIQFSLVRAAAAGYTEYVPPLVVNADSGYGTGQLPDKEGQMYHIQTEDFYLIPTAEVPLTNLYRNVIVSPKDLPIQLCGYTPCFRREA
ncbi:MAG: aminoacyl--tRNA ligase-related protein, partial [Bacteroidota bacterium]